jgi:hypothetical protein
MIPNLTPPEQLAHSTVRIECDLPDGSLSVGTGFFYALNETGKTNTLVIITNKHVVNASIKGRFVMTFKDAGGNLFMGRHRIFQLHDFASLWKQHPDSSVDLCAMPIGPLLCMAGQQGVELFYKNLDRSFLPSKDDIEKMLGNEEVTMVGYPNGLWDAVNNLPIFRRGIIATSYKADWNGKKEFLIDAACFPGSSGSPVLLFDMHSYKTREGIFIGESRVKLLGVLWGGPQYTVEGEIQIVPVPTRQEPISVVTIPNNLGFVIKAERLLDFESMFADSR